MAFPLYWPDRVGILSAARSGRNPGRGCAHRQQPRHATSDDMIRNFKIAELRQELR
jgi:hypothetical protein